MAVPKRRTSKSRHRKRHAQWKVEATPVVRCRNCGGKRQPHVACPYCGHYKGRQVMEVRIQPAE